MVSLQLGHLQIWVHPLLGKDTKLVHLHIGHRMLALLWVVCLVFFLLTVFFLAAFLFLAMNFS